MKVEPASRTVSGLVGDLRNLGVEGGDVLLVHTSFRSIRPVEGGPGGLIRALMRSVEPGGSIVMPSWPGDGRVPFDPGVTDAAEDLGVVARTFWRLPGVLRTAHVQAFAAAGPAASFILGDPLPLPPHIPESPVGRVHDLDGKVLLLGVHHDANTTIHLGEVLAGVPYGIPKTCWAEGDGKATTVPYRENDHCCARFRLVDDWVRSSGEQAEGRVGHATGRLVSSRAIVAAVVSKLSVDPLLFLHDPSDACEECDLAHESIHV